MTLPGAVIEESLFAPFVQDDRPLKLVRSLNLPFHNLGLFRLALTHRSVLHEWATVDTDQPLPHSNERLEFLGDAYLGMIVAEELFHRAPDAQEGELTSWRVSLVRGTARHLGAGDQARPFSTWIG